MIENRPIASLISHLVLVIGILIVALGGMGAMSNSGY